MHTLGRCVCLQLLAQGLKAFDFSMLQTEGLQDVVVSFDAKILFVSVLGAFFRHLILWFWIHHDIGSVYFGELGLLDTVLKEWRAQDTFQTDGDVLW